MGGKVFCANAEVQKHKFFAIVNQVITLGRGLSEEILMHVLKLNVYQFWFMDVKYGVTW